MNKVLLDYIANKYVVGFEGSFLTKESNLVEAYNRLRDAHNSNVKETEYRVTEDKDLDRYINHLLSDDDLEALASVLVTYNSVLHHGLEAKDVNQEHFIDLFVKYTLIGSLGMFQQAMLKLPEEKRKDLREDFKAFQDYITTDPDGLKHKFVDGGVEHVSYITEVRPLVGFAQFLNYAIIELFGAMDLIDKLRFDATLKIQLNQRLSEMMQRTETKIEPMDIKELFA